MCSATRTVVMDTIVIISFIVMIILSSCTGAAPNTLASIPLRTEEGKKRARECVSTAGDAARVYFLRA